MKMQGYVAKETGRLFPSGHLALRPVLLVEVRLAPHRVPGTAMVQIGRTRKSVLHTTVRTPLFCACTNAERQPDPPHAPFCHTRLLLLISKRAPSQARSRPRPYSLSSPRFHRRCRSMSRRALGMLIVASRLTRLRSRRASPSPASPANCTTLFVPHYQNIASNASRQRLMPRILQHIAS